MGQNQVATEQTRIEKEKKNKHQIIDRQITHSKKHKRYNQALRSKHEDKKNSSYHELALRYYLQQQELKGNLELLWS